MNHPLNNVGWSEVRDRLCNVLTLLSMYLERQLKKEKLLAEKVYVVRWNQFMTTKYEIDAIDETSITVCKTWEEAEQLVKKKLIRTYGEKGSSSLCNPRIPYMSLAECATWAYDHNAAVWDIQECWLKHHTT